LARYAFAVQQQRGGGTAGVLTIRERDLQSLAVMYDVAPPDLTEMLVAWGVLTTHSPTKS
jgi:hypothetical protein